MDRFDNRPASGQRASLRRHRRFRSCFATLPDCLIPSLTNTPLRSLTSPRLHARLQEFVRLAVGRLTTSLPWLFVSFVAPSLPLLVSLAHIFFAVSSLCKAAISWGPLLHRVGVRPCRLPLLFASFVSPPLPVLKRASFCVWFLALLGGAQRGHTRDGPGIFVHLAFLSRLDFFLNLIRLV